MNKYILTTIIILWNILHISFLKLNEILKIPDSFAYLQMAHNFKELSVEGFWNGWFGFLYSLPIAFIDWILKNDMISAFLVNIVLFNILILICYALWKTYLQSKYNVLFIILLFLSPILLNYNIHILSENMYIPLFMILFIWVLKYQHVPNFSWNVFLWFILALLYFTRAEAFIYIGSIWLVLLYLLFTQYITFSKAFTNYITIILTFFICIFPYLFYMHSFTGEWWLTNKWSSNLRQAELRWVSKMDDDGFEQAVWELTSDNHHLIAWFAWGLKYDTPQKWQNFQEYLLKNPTKIIQRVQENQIKLYTNTLPNIILWNAKKLYESEWSSFFYQNKLFLFLLIIPILFWIYWIIVLIKNWEWYLVFSFFSFFGVASLFFTLFFVLERYFVIFVPLFIFFIVYGIEKAGMNLKNYLENIKYIFSFILLTWLSSLGTLSYYNTFVYEDVKYEVKKEAGERIKKNDFRNNVKILERFPVVTYYAGSNERWLTPYTSKLENLVEYAKFNGINYLIVDSIDFKKYRSNLIYLLDKSNEKYVWLNKIKEFIKNDEKVIVYRIQ